MLNIIVTVKQVVDPEAPPSTFRIDPEAKRAIAAPGVPPVLNPYDENALEAALRIKDLHQCKVTTISMGTKLAKAVLRKCLAAGEPCFPLPHGLDIPTPFSITMGTLPISRVSCPLLFCLNFQPDHPDMNEAGIVDRMAIDITVDYGSDEIPAQCFWYSLQERYPDGAHP